MSYPITDCSAKITIIMLPKQLQQNILPKLGFLLSTFSHHQWCASVFFSPVLFKYNKKIEAYHSISHINKEILIYKTQLLSLLNSNLYEFQGRGTMKMIYCLCHSLSVHHLSGNSLSVHHPLLIVPQFLSESSSHPTVSSHPPGKA